MSLLFVPGYTEAISLISLSSHFYFSKMGTFTLFWIPVGEAVTPLSLEGLRFLEAFP